ncbi:MAG: hypothetical protein JWL72_687 [Ilumatobacteraceae bacterium]|nr:hypothetical protein [Ilumatobacteraceae bacterium]MCU1387349.1 hypothetical protein [Ilumatobacteraceae bacterium]
MRRVVFLVVALLAVLTPARALAATAPPGSSGDASTPITAPATTIDNTFLDTKRNLTDCMNNPIGLPGCGVEPTHPGDPGGPLQAITFGVLALGIFIICWRVVRSVKARDAALQGQITDAR